MQDEHSRSSLDAYLRRDPFAEHMGATLEDYRPGYARASLTVTEGMLNFHGLTHGGVVGAISDIAFGVAANSHGQVAVAININMTLLKGTRAGARLIATAVEVELGGPLGLYEITVRDERGDLVARTQAQVYRKREHFVEADKKP